MEWILSVIMAVSCAMVLVAKSPEESPVAARRDQLKTALQQEWEYQMRTYPEFATSVGDNRYNDRLSDYSAEAFAAQLQHAQHVLPAFEAIDPAGFPEQERLSRELMIRSLREQIEGAKFKDWEMPVDQMNGLHIGLANLPSSTTFHTVKDYQDYLARLHQIPRVLDQATADMRLGLGDHLVPPRFLLEKVVVQAQDIASKPVKDSPFSQPVNKFPAGISETEQKELREAVFNEVTHDVAPAYARLAEFLRNDYAPKGRTEWGIWALPDGDARYRFYIRQMTTTDMLPDAIHKLGVKQVAEIETEMLKIARQQGFND